MSFIAPKVRYLTRAEWGANPAYPRLGGPEQGYALIPRDKRTYAIWHHTVLIDSSDRSPNVWEDLEWAKLKMQRLQTIRPDLGADVPYSFVGFFRPAGELLICEGRGYDRSGAHTAGVDGRSPYPYNYFNVSGIATSMQGDFENYAFDLGPWLPAINVWNGHLKHEFPSLTSMTVCGQLACGHRDYSLTACPGQHLYRRLPEFTFQEPQEEEVKTTLVWDYERSRLYWLGPWGAAWITKKEDADALIAELGGPTLALAASSIDATQRE